MALRTSLSDIKRPSSPATTAPEPAPSVPDTSSLEEPVEPTGYTEQPGEIQHGNDAAVTQANIKRQAAVVSRKPRATVQRIVTDVETDLRSAIADVESAATDIKQQIAVYAAKFEQKLEALRSQHVELSSQLADHLFKKL